MKKSIDMMSIGSGKVDTRNFKTPKMQKGDVSWVFELLGWNKHAKRRK